MAGDTETNLCSVLWTKILTSAQLPALCLQYQNYLLYVIPFDRGFFIYEVSSVEKSDTQHDKTSKEEEFLIIKNLIFFS